MTTTATATDEDEDEIDDSQAGVWASGHEPDEDGDESGAIEFSALPASLPKDLPLPDGRLQWAKEAAGMIIMEYVVEDTDVINGLIAQYKQLGWSHTIDLDRGPTMSAHTLTRDGNTLNLSFIVSDEPVLTYSLTLAR